MDRIVDLDVPGRGGEVDLGSGRRPKRVSLWSSSNRRLRWAALPLATSAEIVPGEGANSRFAVSTSLGAGSGVESAAGALDVFPVGAGKTGRCVIKLSSPAELAPEAEAVSASETT